MSTVWVEIGGSLVSEQHIVSAQQAGFYVRLHMSHGPMLEGPGMLGLYRENENERPKIWIDHQEGRKRLEEARVLVDKIVEKYPAGKRTSLKSPAYAKNLLANREYSPKKILETLQQMLRDVEGWSEPKLKEVKK